MAAQSGQRWTIVLLTCRAPTTDFRLPLAEELRELGHDVFYVHLKRRPRVVDMGGSSPGQEWSLPAFLFYMHRTFGPIRPLLVLNSTNLVFPVLSNLLRLVCGGIWIFDMHDDLLYGRTGVARVRSSIAQRLLLWGSDRIVHAAPTLKELFPSSIHLGNASNMTAIAREKPDFQRLLILASIDERLDFEFLADAARLNPEVIFDIFGQISEDDPAIRTKVESLTDHIPNVRYRGPYINSDLPHILSDYAVTLAPYATQSRLTQFIDPLRYYHCLNSGMEVISTDIPKARDLSNVLHIINAPQDIAPLLKALDRGDGRRNRGATLALENWRTKAIALMTIAAKSKEPHQAKTKVEIHSKPKSARHE